MNLNNAYYLKEKIAEILQNHYSKNLTVEIFFAGSQSILFNDLNINHNEIIKSMELDCFSITKDKELEDDIYNYLWVLGELSEFHKENDFYLEPIGQNTVKLGKNWRNRVIDVDKVNNISFYSISIEDLILSKYIASRPKDYDYNQSVIQGSLVNKKLLLKILNEEYSDLSISQKKIIKEKIKQHFNLPQINVLNNKKTKLS